VRENRIFPPNISGFGSDFEKQLDNFHIMSAIANHQPVIA